MVEFMSSSVLIELSLINRVNHQLNHHSGCISMLRQNFRQSCDRSGYLEINLGRLSANRVGLVIAHCCALQNSSSSSSLKLRPLPLSSATHHKVAQHSDQLDQNGPEKSLKRKHKSTSDLTYQIPVNHGQQVVSWAVNQEAIGFKK